MAAHRPDLVFIPPSGVLELDRLAALAAEFDSIGKGETYPAREFIVWIQREVEYRRAVQEGEHRRVLTMRSRAHL